MFNEKTLFKKTLMLILIASACFIVSFLLSMSLYMFCFEYFHKHTVDIFVLLKISITVLFFLLGALFFSVSRLLGRTAVERNQRKELTNFKNFTEMIHNSESDMDVYDTMYKFISKMPQVSNICLFYPSEKSQGSDVWQNMTNFRIPICSMSERTCPVIKNGSPCIVKDIKTDINCSYQGQEYKQGCYFCLPLSNSENSQGLIQIYSKRPFAFDEVSFSRINSYIETSKSILTSKKALNTLNKEAHTDRLTKLYNRSFTEPYLENQIEAASMLSQHLSIIMVDIDFFKKINDTYGHSAGDHVLSIFSSILLKCTRKTDLVSRYGGEEFLIILPRTTTETAYSIAERIRETVAGTFITPLGNISIPSITCSLGISTFPDYCDSKMSLINTADEALYKAKHSGRNCAKVYSPFDVSSSEDNSNQTALGEPVKLKR